MCQGVPRDVEAFGKQVGFLIPVAIPDSSCRVSLGRVSLGRAFRVSAEHFSEAKTALDGAVEFAANTVIVIAMESLSPAWVLPRFGVKT